MIYTIESDGQQFDIEGPDNATEDELRGAVDSHFASAKAPAPQQNRVEKFLGLPPAPPEGRNPLDAYNQFTDEMAKTGTEMTEALGKRGVPAPISAAVGMVPTFAPEIISSMVGGPGAKAVARGTATGRALVAPTLKTAGEALGKAEAKAGIQVLEEATNAPRTRKTIIEFANRLGKVVREGKEKALDPKTLNMLKTETGNILDFLKVAKQGAQPKQLVSKGTIARLAQSKDALVRELGSQVPEVGEALKTYAGSAGRAQAIRALGRGVKTAAKVASVGIPGAAAIKYLFR